MPVNIRPYPILTGEDAKRFLERQKEHKIKLEEKVKKKLEESQKNK